MAGFVVTFNDLAVYVKEFAWGLVLSVVSYISHNDNREKNSIRLFLRLSVHKNQYWPEQVSPQDSLNPNQVFHREVLCYTSCTMLVSITDKSRHIFHIRSSSFPCISNLSAFWRSTFTFFIAFIGGRRGGFLLLRSSSLGLSAASLVWCRVVAGIVAVTIGVART